MIGSSIVLALSILFIVCWANSNCIWLDNVYLSGLDLDAADEATDNQTASLDATGFTAQPNTTLVALGSNPSLDGFITTTINSKLFGKCAQTDFA